MVGCMRILVTGGAGYIGSHTVVQLLGEGHDVHVVDSFVNSSPSVLDRVARITGTCPTLHELDLTDRDATAHLLARVPFDAAFHFAGLKSVNESVADPLGYYRNNLDSTLSLLQALDATGVRNLVFSSSATVYGPRPASPVSEDAPLSATNPYGWSKVMIEQILRDVAAADPRWRIALLRYFNPAGAHPSGLIGERPTGAPNNLMPYVAQVTAGERGRLHVFGGDYDTVDGTGVRDFIHIEDLADGHLAALRHLTRSEPQVGTWNLGTGEGTSVLQLVAAFARAAARPVPYVVVERRPGDVATCYADPSRAEAELGWRAERTIDEMCEDSWRWQQTLATYSS